MSRKGLALAGLALFATLAHAEDYLSPTDERVRLSLGVVRVSNDTNMLLDSSAGVPGTPVNGEQDFGLDKTDFEAKLQAMVRVGERHRLRFDYFSLDRTGSAIATDAIIFRDAVIQPGAPMDTSMSIRSLAITYEYSFLHSERYELAATLGVNVTDISTRLKVTTEAAHINQAEDAAGPFPTVGLDGTYVVSKRFYFDARGQYLKANVDDLQGSLTVFEADALYRLRPNVAFALGYSGTRVHLASFQAKTMGYFNLNSSGPELFVRVSF
jgi:hypothetical protein